MASFEESFSKDNTPVPSSKSGKRFEELYRLKGVVSAVIDIDIDIERYALFGRHGRGHGISAYQMDSIHSKESSQCLIDKQCDVECIFGVAIWIQFLRIPYRMAYVISPSVSRFLLFQFFVSTCLVHSFVH